MCIYGGPASGKTTVLHQVAKDLLKMGKVVQICASTVMSNYTWGIQTITFQNLFGLALMRNKSVGEIVHDVLNSELFNKVRNAIVSAEVIFVDNINIVNSKDFECAEIICRTIKGNQYVFGGLQILASFKTHSLPPIT